MARPESGILIRIILGSIILLLSAAALAQDQILVRSDLVLVPVSVRGSDGELVTGLTRDDFIILEDGRTQTISMFDDQPQRLSAAVVIDIGIGGVSLHRVTSQLSAIGAGITPEDEVSVFRYGHIVDQVSDFTADPKVIQKSFDTIAKLAESTPEEQHELVTGGPGWLRSILGIFPDGSKGKAKNHVLHNAIYDAAMALKARPTDRMKTIFIISDGQASGPANVHTLAQNTELLLANNIQIFAVSTDYARFGSYGSLSSYSQATGGDVYNGATDISLEHAFNQVTEQARHQYVLGYTSTNTTGNPGAFRKIEVKTRETKQIVTHRKGYIRFNP